METEKKLVFSKWRFTCVAIASSAMIPVTRKLLNPTYVSTVCSTPTVPACHQPHSHLQLRTMQHHSAWEGQEREGGGRAPLSMPASCLSSTCTPTLNLSALSLASHNDDAGAERHLIEVEAGLLDADEGVDDANFRDAARGEVREGAVEGAGWHVPRCSAARGTRQVSRDKTPGEQRQREGGDKTGEESTM